LVQLSNSTGCSAGLQPLPVVPLVVPELPELDAEPALVAVPDVEVPLVPVALLVEAPVVPIPVEVAAVLVVVPRVVPELVPVPVEVAELVDADVEAPADVATEAVLFVEAAVVVAPVEPVAPKVVASPVVPVLPAVVVGRPVPVLVALTLLAASVDESLVALVELLLTADEAVTPVVPELELRPEELAEELAPMVVERPVLLAPSVPSSLAVVVSE